VPIKQVEFSKIKCLDIILLGETPVA